jgi:membrane fusion protein (multidrug efflux system)
MSVSSATRLSTCVALLGAAVLVGCGDGRSQAAKNAPPAQEVGVVTLATQALVLRTELPGRTLAAQSAEIRPQVSGLLKARLYTEGTVVKAGQPLYEIEAASYQATVQSAQAGVAKAQAALQSGQLNATRQQELLAADAGSRKDQEDAQATLLQAQAELKTAQATLATAQIDLARTRITAPIGGRVDTSTVMPGALVTANQTTALTTVQQMDPMLVDIPQSSVEVLKLRRQLASGALKDGELAIRLVLEDGSPYAHPGRLKVSGVAVNTSTGAVTLRAQVPNPEGLLLPGMYVRAVMDQGQDPAALLVPQAGITRDARGQAKALVVGADGKVQQRAVKVAEALQGQWRVTEGLQAGERLIVEGTSKVRDGQLVHAVAVTTGQPAAAASAAPAASAALR